MKLASSENEEDTDTAKKVGDILRSSSARKIVDQVTDKQLSFSEMRKNLKMTSGRLNYHLLKLRSAGILKRTRGERYALTRLGMKVSNIVRRTLKELEQSS